jgi:methyl-accepting chemotaxis protein
MAEISAASAQQSQGVDQITTAVEEMNLVTQRTAASSERSATAAAELKTQAEQLAGLVDEFTLSGTADHAAAAAPRPAVAAALAAARPGAPRPTGGRGACPFTGAVC